MKKAFIVGIIGGLAVLIFVLVAYSQENKETELRKQPQSEWAPVSESYVIGPEDVLYIHVWKEEALSRAVLVRMDGKISLPLVDDVQAAGLTARQLKEVLTKRLKEFVTPTIQSNVRGIAIKLSWGMPKVMPWPMAMQPAIIWQNNLV